MVNDFGRKFDVSLAGNLADLLFQYGDRAIPGGVFWVANVEAENDLAWDNVACAG